MLPPAPPTRLRRSGQFSRERRMLLSAYVGVVVIAAVGILIGSALTAHLPVGEERLRFLILLTLCVAGNWRPRHVRPHMKTSLDDAPMFAAVLLLPLAHAVIAVFVGKLVGQLQGWHTHRSVGRGQPWFVPLFNISLTIVQVACGGGVIAVFGPGAPLEVNNAPQYLGAIVLAAVVLYSVNALLLAGVVGMQRGVNPFVGWWAANRHGFTDRVALYTVGAVAAVVGGSYPWALLALALPMPSNFFAFDHAARAYLWEEAATRDVLTSLYNRLYFFRRFESALRRAEEHGEQCGLILLDLDGLKILNDTYGHHVGDAALVQLAEFLKATMRAQDVIARIGGDEFAMLLPQTPPEGVTSVADRVRAALPIPWPNGAHPTLMFSLGVAHLAEVPRMAGEDRAAAIQRIIHRADIALYREKASHKGTREAAEREAATRETAAQENADQPPALSYT